MPQNLRLLDAWIPSDAWPHIACPVCFDGSLNPHSLTHQESAESKRWHGHENWEPEFIEGTFQGLLRCNRPTCEETISVAGDYSVGRPLAPVGNWDADWADFYRLRYARPALTLMTCPEGTPETVSSAIQSASEVIWLDPGASANRLRVAVEELLTDKHVRRFRTANGKRSRLTAHARIQEFKTPEHFGFYPNGSSLQSRCKMCLSILRQAKRDATVVRTSALVVGSA
jgi:hypothetical protein